MGLTHPAGCGHCAAIRGTRNPAKRADVRAAISVATRAPGEAARRSRAVSGSANPRYSVGGSYKAAHLRVVAERGPAASHRCAECGKPAAEWALNKAGPLTIGPGPRGAMLPYALDTSRYEPLCRSCHRRRDARRKVRE